MPCNLIENKIPCKVIEDKIINLEAEINKNELNECSMGMLRFKTKIDSQLIDVVKEVFYFNIVEINKTIYNLDTILLLEYNNIITQLEQMSDVRIDILLQMLKTDRKTSEYIQLHTQLIYLDKNINLCLKVLSLKEEKLFKDLLTYKLSLNEYQNYNKKLKERISELENEKKLFDGYQTPIIKEMKLK